MLKLLPSTGHNTTFVTSRWLDADELSSPLLGADNILEYCAPLWAWQARRVFALGDWEINGFKTYACVVD